MSVTIDSLDIQISSSAGAAEANIDRLAKSLGELRSNGKLGVVNRNLNGLADAIGKLKGSTDGLTGFASLTSTIQRLSGIQKPSGLTSTITALKKIPEIVDKLDDGTITMFTGKMEDLAIALGPLATRLNEVARGFSRLPSQVSKVVTATNRMGQANRQAGSSFRDLGESVNGASLNMATGLFNLQSVIGIVHTVRDALTGVISQAIEWDGIQYRFGRAFGEDAEETLAYVEKISDALKINKQYFMQHASMYGSLLSGFGMAQDKVTTISIGLTELSYDIWAAYNDRYKTLEDASEAVRSAITGEIEPIRNAGIALTEASMQEYLDSIGLAHIRMSNLSEASKAQVRYATMVNAAMNQGIVGTYASEMQTAEGALRTLTQQTKGLSQALGSLFIPILSAVIPWVSAFVSIIYKAVAAVAAFFSLPFFNISWGGAKGSKGLAGGLDNVAKSAGSAGKAIGGAAGAAKDLQDYTMGFDELNIIDPPSAGGGGGGGGGAGGGAGAGLDLDLDTLWDDSVFAQASKQVDEITKKIENFAKEHKLLLGAIGSIAGFLAFMKVLRGLNNLIGLTKTIDNLKTAFSALDDVFKKFKGPKKIFTTGWIGNFTSGLKMLKQGQISFKTFLLGVTGGVGTQNFFASAKDLVIRIGGSFTSALKQLPKLLANGVRAIPGWGWVIGAIVSVLTLAIVDYDFTDMGYKLGHALGTAFKKVGEWLGAAGDWIASVGKAVLDGLNSAWEWVKEEFDINSVFEGILLMLNPAALITKVVPKLIEIGAEVLPGIWEGIKNGWNNFWGNIKEFIDGFIKGWKDALGIASPSKVFADIGKDIMEGLLNGIKERWKKVQDWFNTNVAPKLTIAYWKEKVSGIKKGISDKISEIKGDIEGVWNKVKTWFDSNVAPKLTVSHWKEKFSSISQGLQSKWTEAKSWWDNNKPSLAAVKTVVDSIKDNLSSAWTTAKTWWDNNKPSLSKVSFGLDSIVTTLQEGWASAKKWWDSNVKLSIPKLNFIVSYKMTGLNAVQKGIVKALGLTGWPSLHFAASGGVFSAGSMIWAGEAGPEIVTNARGGRTGVMNVEQLQSAVSAGVYSAVMAAMSQTQGGSQAVNVYLDGKQIYSSVKKTEAERGMTLMGNQLGYAY